MEREPERPDDAEPHRPAVGGSRRRLVTSSVVVAALVVIAVLAFRLGSGSSTRSAPISTRAPTPTATASPTVSDIFRQVGPSVVVIRAGDALGTGVVAADDGRILTANHVIAKAKADDITVTFADGTKARAKVASSDPAHDVATLTPASLPELLVPATLGGKVDVGAAVVAIGNPLGLTYSVSSGVVSGLNRSSGTNDGDFSGLIQFDASVNPGSSGGPLLDGRGRVIGIVVSIADPGHDDAFAGIGFAVPIGAALSGGDGDGNNPGNGPQI